MLRTVILIITITTSLVAYNPFFEAKPTPKKKTKIKIETKPVTKIIYQKPPVKKKKYNITYYGYIQTNKGNFALIDVDKKTLAIKQGEKLYIDGKSARLVKITSNYFVIKSGKSDYQTIYFSKKGKK